MAAEQIPTPPSYRFRPTKRELVEFYLLPRARGQDPFPSVLIEDDAAGSTLPWDLFERHGVGSEDEAYFIVRTSEAKKKPGARQDRGCDGGVGTWKMQSSLEKRLRVGGKRIRVHVSNLNLHMGKGKNSGSVGWVMHEYSIVSPPCPVPIKICHIAFSGHGRKRMRAPDGQQGRQSPLLGSRDFQGFPSAASEQYPGSDAEVPTTEQQDIVAPQLMVQQPTMPEVQQLSAGELDFWSSIGVDVQSNNCFEQEQSTGLQNSWVVPNTDTMATGLQSSYVVPNTNTMATGVHSSYVAPNNAMAKGVQSSYVVPNTDTMATWVQNSYVVPNNGAMATGVQSKWVVPNTGTMATGVQSSWVAGDLDDFCRSLLGNVKTNCAAPEFGNKAAGTPGGGCSLICK